MAQTRLTIVVDFDTDKESLERNLELLRTLERFQEDIESIPSMNFDYCFDTKKD